MSRVELTEDQKAFVQRGIESGRYEAEEDAVREALGLWEEVERTRAELLAEIDLAEQAIDRGEGNVLTPDSVREVTEDIKRRGRTRFAALEQRRLNRE